jgi:hypothetical protein
MGIPINPKIHLMDFILVMLTLIFATVFRVSFLLLYPVLTVILFFVFRWRLHFDALYLLAAVGIVWLFSWRHGFYLSYNLVSLYYVVPLILLLCASPKPVAGQSQHLHRFIVALSIIMVANNILGMFQYARLKHDDSFEGFYGTFTVSQNGLSIINSILFFYYFLLWRQVKEKWYLVLSIFFVVCSIMSFYGAGLMVFMATLAIYLFKPSLKNVIRFGLIFGIGVVALYVLMNVVSDRVLEYNMNILKKFWKGLTTGQDMPRKLAIFKNYYQAYSHQPVDLLFGSGPGTFNSRSAFMVGSPTYFNVSFIKSAVQPYYFATEAYPLWNPSVITWYDGFMSQPFSSLLALLGEYGIIVTVFIGWVIAANYRRSMLRVARAVPTVQLNVAGGMIKFLTILLVLLLVIDNYMEYPEIVSLIILLIKLSEGIIAVNARQQKS